MRDACTDKQEIKECEADTYIDVVSSCLVRIELTCAEAPLLVVDLNCFDLLLPRRYEEKPVRARPCLDLRHYCHRVERGMMDLNTCHHHLLLLVFLWREG